VSVRRSAAPWLAALVVATAFGGTATAAPSSGLRRACASAPVRHARCFAEFRVRQAARHALAAPLASRFPAGLWPADIASAYALPTARGSGQIIAIVDAFDDPRAESDLAHYRSRFGLPACTTANGCFKKINERGKRSPLPAGDPGWGVEISLDLQAVSASCPRCKLLLVEADQPSFDDLGAAVDTAVRWGARAVSNSYGNDEFNGMAAWAPFYDHPGVPILVASGDFGFGPAQFPAVERSAIAVGGTSLVAAPGTRRGWRESAWEGAGSGCSAYIAKPAWQHDRNCLMRVTADLSAVADPDTGLAVYDTFGLGPDNGWIVVGGTSLSSPLVAGMFGLAGNGGAFRDASPVYAHAGAFFDAVGGSNGFCGGDYLCTGLPGFDAPTGVGTPDGVAGL
jgi:subtilase family serine protease